MKHLGLGMPLPMLFLLTRMFSPCLLQHQHCHYQVPTVCRGLEQNLGFNMELSYPPACALNHHLDASLARCSIKQHGSTLVPSPGPIS